jgi:hypothetical protein
MINLTFQRKKLNQPLTNEQNTLADEKADLPTVVGVIISRRQRKGIEHHSLRTILNVWIKRYMNQWQNVE